MRTSLPRILHTSDTHLGHQQYPRSDPRTGLNQREQDHYDTWSALIDAAVADPPDVFIHAGDLFDGVRPSNRALAAAMDGLIRLSQAGIPAVIIAGNHEHPKMRGTGSPFRLFDHIPGVHVVYKGRREHFDIAGLRIHAVPQCPDRDTLRAQVTGAEPGPGQDVLVIHGAVSDIEAFKHAEFNEQTLDAAWFEAFDYVALGHYHATTEIAPTAWYCGAPDRVSIGEAGQQKGYLDVRIEDEVHVTFQPLAVRPYADLPPIDAGGLDAEAVQAAAVHALSRVPDGAVARLRVDGIDTSLRGAIDQRAIRAASPAIHLDLVLAWEQQAHDVQGRMELGALEDEFAAFAAQQPLEGVERARLMEMAHALLEETA